MKKLFSILILISACSVAFAQTPIIITVAGTGSYGYTGDGGAAVSAKLYNPTGVAVDSAGNVYIADQDNCVIRKILTSGAITTVAGYAGTSASRGFGGDGGAATRALLDGPTGVAVDHAGNIYIADNGNSRIRMVNTSGIISTFAGSSSVGFSGDGGAATAAKLWGPMSVAVDNSGNVYIADKFNNRVRKVNTSGTITTIAGNGYSTFSGDGGEATAASVYNPSGVIVDGARNVYIADYENDRIRKVNTSGIISTIAGNGYGTYAGDGGDATAASVNAPVGLAIDSHGNIYVADVYNQRIRTISASGTISTLAGTGTYGFSGDGGDATAARLNYPYGVCVNTAGEVFVADQVNQRVRKISCLPTVSSISGAYALCGGATTTLVDTTSGGTWSSSDTSIATISNTGVVTGIGSGGVILTYTISTSCGSVFDTQFVNVIPVPSGTISGPGSVCVGHSITLVLGSGSWTSSATSIATVSATGVVTGLATGVAIISYSYSNSCGSISDTQAVTVGALASAGTISGTSSICLGTTDTLTETVTGGTWSTGSASVATVGASGIVGPVAAGSGAIYYSVTNSCGTATDTFLIHVLAVPGTPVISGYRSICPADSLPLTAAPSGGTWVSGTASVATISTSGMVHAISSGATIITYTTTNICGSGTDTQAISVLAAPTVAAITGGNTICVGALTTLADGTAGGTWRTSSPAVASVTSAGVTKGIAAGNAVITYSVSNACGSAFDTLAVTIIGAPAPGNISGSSRVCAGNTTTLTDPEPGGVWASSNTAIATVDGGGIVTAVTVGVATLSYTVTNSCSAASATLTFVVNPIDSCTTGVGTLNSSFNNLSIYPNPGDGIFSFTLPENAQKVTAQVFDIYGRLVTTKVVEGASSILFTFDITNQPAGIYIIKIAADERLYVARAVKN